MDEQENEQKTHEHEEKSLKLFSLTLKYKFYCVLLRNHKTFNI